MSRSADITHGHSVGFNLGAIALAVSLAGLGCAYLLDSIFRPAPAERVFLDPTPVDRTLSGTDLHIPAGWLRHVSGDESEFAKQIELRLFAPLGASGTTVAIDVTLLPRSRVKASAGLLDGVYLHQFQMDQLSGPPGLVGKPLRPEEGYQDEIVWYDPLSGNPFVAKCGNPMPGTKVGRCIRTAYLGPGIAALYAFDASVLDNWRRFDEVLAPQLWQIGAL